MLEAEILKAAPQFELPSGLPEVIQALRRLVTDSDVDIALSPLFMEAANLLNCIPAMVAEIGRLRNRVDELQGSMKLDGRYLSNMESLRALNEELREALKPFADAADAAERALCKHNTDEILIRLGRLREARTILAKCESKSATTQPRIPGLPAQAPTATSSQPGPGGIIETEKGK